MMRSVFSFIAFFITLAFVGIFLFTPKVDAACTTDPVFKVVGKTGGIRSVVYHLTLVDNCVGTNTYRIWVSGLPTDPRQLHADWRVRKNDGSWSNWFTQTDGSEFVRRSVGTSVVIDIEVRRDITYYHPDADYTYVRFKAALDSNRSINDVYLYDYQVVNGPDLKIINFNFPGGPTCQTSNPYIRIRNLGWFTLTHDFDVRINNGNGYVKTWRVTQQVDHDEIIDLSSRFRNMPIPPIGQYTARAVVDPPLATKGEILEEDETNNEQTDTYNSTTCVTPPPTTAPVNNPIGWHDSSDCNISRGWTCDADNYSQALAVHFYEGSTFLGSTIANQSRPDVPAAGYCGGNPNVGFSFTTPNSLKDGNSHTITAYAINIGSGTGNPKLNGTPKTITCPVPSTSYSISGGVFNDLDESTRKDSGESYTSGDIQITNSSGTLVYSAPSTVGFTAPNLPAGTYRVSYTNYPSISATTTLTYPTYTAPTAPNILVTVGPSCIEDPSKPITCSAGNVTNANFGIAPKVSAFTPWINGVGGDMRQDHTMDNLIPDGYYFSEEGSSPFRSPGVVFSQNYNLNIGSPISDKTSIRKWIVNEKYAPDIINTEYSIMKILLTKGGVLNSSTPNINTVCASGNASNCSLISPFPGGIYTAGEFEPVVINNASTYNFAANSNYIFLIEGDLTINADLIVPKTSTVLFIVKGDITIGENVKTLDGIYSTNGFFTVKGAGLGSDEALNIGGSVIANAGRTIPAGTSPFKNERDLGDLNETTSAVNISFRTDFIMNMPEFLRYKSYNIKEVAPGTAFR